jgi:transcription elongation factor Elf1
MQIKAADGRNEDVIALERLLDRPDVPMATRKRIQDEIAQVRSGEKAERDAAYDIELYFGRSDNWATIHDLRIEIDGLAAQMDHLLINRLAEIWICESKAFAEGVSVNEYGEWSRWWNGRQTGMPSPIEQNHRHVHLLKRVFDDGLVRLPRRLGLISMKPDIKSLVLVSNNARIGRPKHPIKDIGEVIKAEQLKTRVFDEFDKAPSHRLSRVIGREGLEAFARDLAALHRPIAFDWAARFGLPSVVLAKLAAAVNGLASTIEQVHQQTPTQCAHCGVAVSLTVVRFCEAHPQRFDGAIYCMKCQSQFKAGIRESSTSIPTWSAVLARYRAPARLRTVARQAPFIVVTEGGDLRVTPDSSNRYRTLTRADFERSAPLLGRNGRGEVNEASRNSSYVEAILADFRV